MEDRYEVWDEYFEELEQEIRGLNRQAHELGFEPIRIERIEREQVVLEDQAIGAPLTHERVVFRLAGSPPREAGWEFCASIDHTMIGDIVRRIPGSREIDLRRYIETDTTWCDHCRRPHRRIATLVAVNFHGKEERVGWSCLREFLGYGDYERLATELRHVRGILTAVGEAAILGMGSGKPLS